MIMHVEEGWGQVNAGKASMKVLPSSYSLYACVALFGLPVALGVRSMALACYS